MTDSVDEIADVDANGARDIQLFYEAHKEQIRSITRMDENGVIVASYPFASAIGSNISDQAHIREILRVHEPVVSDVGGPGIRRRRTARAGESERCRRKPSTLGIRGGPMHLTADAAGSETCSADPRLD
jgi:hypothetical protein